MSKLPLHVEIYGFDTVDNCLTIAGRKLCDLLPNADSTPAYLYDATLIEQRVKDLRRALPSQVQIHYAIKANPLASVVELISGIVDGLDVASEGELNVALRTNTARRDISFAGPGKRDRELATALEAGITINVESRNELLRLNVIAQARNAVADIAVRVNPGFELKASGMKMSGGPKPFGIDAELVPDLLRDLSTLRGVRFRGFHIFCGSQNLSADSICEAQTNALELALDLTKYAPARPEFINIGGGFGIPLFPGDRRLDVDTIGRRLEGLTQRLAVALPSTQLVIELGRYIVGEAGLYACRVIDKKVSRGTTYLIVDGGMHHHLAASGNFGQVIRKNHPALVGNAVFVDSPSVATVVGPLCTPLDILADRMPLGHAEVGDLIVLFQSGAYGMTASPQRFLGHPAAAEILLR